ncbi:MAG: hypothetical protein ACO3VQ_02515 [Ilumatobacteraceae bacterium]
MAVYPASRSGTAVPFEVQVPDVAVTQSLVFDVSAGDWVGDKLDDLLAVEYGMMLPAAVNFQEDTGTGDRYCTFDVFLFPRTYLINEDVTVNPIPRIEWQESTTVSGTGLPFRSLRLGYTLDRVINSTILKTTGTDSTAENTPSRELRGSRVLVYEPEISEQLSTQAERDALAQDLVEWFSETELTARSWEVTGGMIRNLCDDAALPKVQELLSAPYYQQGPLFRLMTLVATGSGGEKLEFGVTALKAHLSIGKNDWVMRFDDGMNDTTAFGFVLDDNDLGVLDENRI